MLAFRNITDTLGTVEKYVGTKLKSNIDNTNKFFKRMFRGGGFKKTKDAKDKKADAKEKSKEKAKKDSKETDVPQVVVIDSTLSKLIFYRELFRIMLLLMVSQDCRITFEML